MRLLILTACALLLGCASSRKQLARADTYEQHGLLAEAYQSYAALYERRPKEALARVGMRRTAQALLDQKQERAIAAYRMGDLIGGDRAREEALAHQRAMSANGLQLEPSPRMEEQRAMAQRTEADRLYHDAASAYAEDRFTEAEELTGKALKLWPEHREAGHLQRLARTEPLYREGLVAMGKGLWREAYQRFDRAVGIDPAHRDALAKRAECQEKASFTLACIYLYDLMEIPTLMLSSRNDIGTQFLARVKEALLDAKDPFLILVDRENTERLLAEQRGQMNGLYDEQSIAAAGKLLGARYVLATRILRFDDVLSKQLEAQVQVINAETGRIHLSEVVRVNRQEIGRGAPRAQLLERAAKRVALRLQEAGNAL